jgi:hypothetical protein
MNDATFESHEAQAELTDVPSLNFALIGRMVLINCKRLPREEYSKDYDEFLFSIPSTTTIGDATELCRRLQNMRVRLKWMIAAARQLAKDSCQEEQRHLLMGPADDAERYLSLERVDQKLLTSESELTALIDTIKGGTMIAFPEDCAGADVLRRLAAFIDDDATPDAAKAKAHRILSIIDDGAATEDIVLGPVVMWWSGKPLAKDCDFVKYLGKNEKTKIIVKISKEGASAPPREPAVDAKTQSELMAHYFRKQEEEKKIIEDDDISFGNSDWANPRGLKGQLVGIGSVQYKPR